jgi:subtilisin family serine protease
LTLPRACLLFCTQVGIITVAAAGNSNGADACTQSPASAPSAIAVGATDSNDYLAAYSNVGSCLAVFAPGSGIVSAGKDFDTQEATMSGTSMATPHVRRSAASAAALAWHARLLHLPADRSADACLMSDCWVPVARGWIAALAADPSQPPHLLGQCLLTAACTAQVAGVVAMLLQQRPGSSAADIKRWLQAAAVPKTIHTGSPRCAGIC